ncbi:hypothetical protein GHK92_03325 [Nocardioides sp. dk4132]|uniref:hypothetical protein n=1 Tax=unclassified Nocardioides TaxID=2615069 RepID=UPI001295F29E|nr:MULTISPECIES: hypothetical protein [unclassified Nocardioides]MQW74893.1 hypothetical protein [Nocardioides sp. dk4132]QGA07916.1 hypothetical protein GFH29_11285 [Nocardioides sp. dk884]
METDRSVAGVDLYWLPLGAGDNTGCVRVSGRLYESLAARREHRAPVPLFHSALEVQYAGETYALEMAPVWTGSAAGHGVVCEGPVGLACLGRSRLFRYEVRCWRGGAIPDLEEAVGGAQRLSTDPLRAERLLAVVSDFPAATWGRDELGAGEMWNSNSLVAWLLARSGHHPEALTPPRHGRAPGWAAGLAVAAREEQGRADPQD